MPLPLRGYVNSSATLAFQVKGRGKNKQMVLDLFAPSLQFVQEKTALF